MRQNSMLAIVTLGMTVVILSGIDLSWAPSLLWAASSQQCSPDREPRGNRRRHCKRHLARCGKRSSRVPREAPAVRCYVIHRERCAQAGASITEESRLRYHRQPRDLFGWAGVHGPCPDMVALLYFAAWFMLHRSLLGLTHVRGRRQRGPPGSWA